MTVKVHARKQAQEQRIAAIEEKFGQPFADIVKGMRANNLSNKTMAAELDVPMSTFGSWLKKYGLTDKDHCLLASQQAHAERIAAIEEKFSHPFADIVNEMRAKDYSNPTIAAALDVPLGTFYYWLKKYGLFDEGIELNRRFHSGKQAHAERIAAIEAEFGEPFADIVAGMRTNNTAYETIAGALRMSCTTFRRWLKKYDLFDGRSAKPIPRIRPTDQRAQQLGFRNAGQLVIDFRLDEKTNIDIAQALGCHHGYVYYITPESVKGLNIITPRRRAARRQNMQHWNARRRAGQD